MKNKPVTFFLLSAPDRFLQSEHYRYDEKKYRK